MILPRPLTSPLLPLALALSLATAGCSDAPGEPTAAPTPSATAFPGETPTPPPTSSPSQTPTPSPDIVVSEVSLSFGDVALGEEGERVLGILNQGSESLFLTLTLPANPEGQFAIVTPGGGLPDALAAGESLDLTLRFAPASDGEVEGRLRIDTNSATTPRTEVALMGVGLPEEDGDGDGVTTLEGDCDDSDGEIYPGAADVCDGVDNDCDEAIDEEGDPFYRDVDGDGYGTTDTSVATNVIYDCLGEGETPAGYVAEGGDCDDLRDTTYPGAEEACDGRDNDCDGEADETPGGTFYADQDGDGFGDDSLTATGCEPPEGYVSLGGDCDDDDVAQNPDGEEACNLEDDDCDGEVDEGARSIFYPDSDSDGYGIDEGAMEACLGASGFAELGGDCDDNDGGTYPGAGETCDDLDNDCDTEVDEGLGQLFYIDDDGDGFGDGDMPIESCSLEEGLSATGDDCDDGNAQINPGEEDACDSVDNDCDGNVDEGGESIFYRDVDGDGYGDGSDTFEGCGADEGYVAQGGDCDDNDGDAYPGAEEICDGENQDCDDAIDEGVEGTFYLDADQDGFGQTNESVFACEAPSQSYSDQDGDCDDLDSDVYPGAEEICDGDDEDCDSAIDEGTTLSLYVDADGDGFGNPSRPEEACEEGAGLVDDDTDCADDRPDTSPGAEEACDGVDNDCDTQADEGALTTFYGDSDGDGFGVSSTTITGCSAPEGFTEADGDCADDDASINPGALEACNGADDDCDEISDEGTLTTFYADGDSDGYGVEDDTLDACDLPEGYASGSGDCDDADLDVFPGAVEACNGQDDDCDELSDEGTLEDYYIDNDGDGFGDSDQPVPACDADEGVAALGGDCADDDVLTYPGAEEVCDEADNDCDEGIDEGASGGYYADNDGDGFGDPDAPVPACELSEGLSEDNTDCDDDNPDAYPEAEEVCDEVDNNCNGSIDEGEQLTFYGDADDDGFGTAVYTVRACQAPEGFVEESGDCNDALDTVYPGAPERCDFSDNDCDELVDEAGDDIQNGYYLDEDGDGFGLREQVTYACQRPEGYGFAPGDCDDEDALTYPEAEELCDGIDNDCDGIVPEEETPGDDGVRPCEGACTPESLPLERTITMASQFAAPRGNFAPQGMTITANGSLAIIQQQSNELRFANRDTGAYISALGLNLNHTTGVTWDDARELYFVSDYTGNTSTADLWTFSPSGVKVQASTEVLAYGGYPLASGDGILYRGELSSTYDWSGTLMDQIRISTTSAPDNILSTIQVNISEGIGDMAWDGEALWLLAFTGPYNEQNTAVSIYRVDADTGEILGSYRNLANSGAGRKTTGLAFADGKLYVYNWAWSSGVSSTLMVFDASCSESAPSR